ncbi:potassium/sodium hyperpolarization-activated cyclic nucleotide-gated channel 1 [Histomonas meleagridis]|uniref:potassium/sodium hyperpolarization-activated cyclic nucleotide-gated channel 1 n=1 Tax=Histomonas meleagridis TaxID=135588 RepID=UPI003559BEC3|nr:potassium/sodium hyperpolarization-activated cyclic nucleotide-gated channel 1 [Histomonas meleagridis]KAH0805203.1 potassium/sodium hyperpolarization-activated cyclic nucleotide-gated channel 1 [Histomonas meleagridis]
MNDGEEKIKKKVKLPKFWELLSEEDQNGYLYLKATFDGYSFKRSRGHRIETFDVILEAVRKYAEQGKSDDWKRFLVCGVCWIDNAIAINTRQFRLLISKCKSSINGSLQKLRYFTNTSHSESWKILFEKIPFLKGNYAEIRQWTIRYRIPIEGYPLQPNPVPFPIGFQPPLPNDCNTIPPQPPQTVIATEQPIPVQLSPVVRAPETQNVTSSSEKTNQTETQKCNTMPIICPLKLRSKFNKTPT